MIPFRESIWLELYVSIFFQRSIKQVDRKGERV